MPNGEAQKISKNLLNKNILIDLSADFRLSNQYEYLNKLNDWGFKTNPLNRLINGVDNLIKNYNEVKFFVRYIAICLGLTKYLDLLCESISRILILK